AVISGNHIYENGAQAIAPVCGVFVGYGDDLEIADNVLAANGTITADDEKNQQTGLRGGFYIRFAGALTAHLSTSTGRKPALRVHDNRVDQTTGRALTAYVFGPVSCADNHLNSEFTGRFQFIDTFVGGVLILNLGGIHRLLERTLGRYVLRAFAAAPQASLPGGETIFDHNYVRLGGANRSLTSQVIVAADDLGYAANTASVYRPGPFFANAALVADTVRATAARLREDVDHTLSLLTLALRMNTTALNQADHCIIALPAVAPGNVLPTVSAPNQVLDAAFCGGQFTPAPGVGQFFAGAIAANANELGGT